MGYARGPGRLGITDTQRHQFIRLLEEGAYLTHACRVVGISSSAIYNWLAKGGYEGSKKNKNYVPASQAQEPHKSFAQDVAQAEALAEMILLTSISRQAKKDGRLALAFLARRWPERYGKSREKRAPFADDEGSSPDQQVSGNRVQIFIPSNNRGDEDQPTGDAT